jgi:hypothetical protein
MDAMRDLCRDRFEAFGTAGQASKIKVIAMDDMAKRYASGALDPQTNLPRLPEKPIQAPDREIQEERSTMNKDAKTEIKGKERYKAGCAQIRADGLLGQ